MADAGGHITLDLQGIMIGSAMGRALPGCNVTRLTRGSLVNENSTAEVQGNIDWY